MTTEIYYCEEHGISYPKTAVQKCCKNSIVTGTIEVVGSSIKRIEDTA